MSNLVVGRTLLANEPLRVQIVQPDSGWMDYASLGADLLGPLVAAIFGLWILRITKRLEHTQWRNQKLIEKRIELWDRIGPIVNDIYCYCLRVGSWKGFTPPDVITKKREADKLVHLSRPYFSGQFYIHYQALIETCFKTYQGHGLDAKLKSVAWEHRNVHANWQDSWDAHFMDTPLDEELLRAANDSLLQQVRAELNPGEDQ